MSAEPGLAGSTAGMRAIRLHGPGGLEGLVTEQVQTPRLQEGEVLVRVHAAAITRGELDWPIDRLPATPSYELSGVVATVSPDADSVSIGDPVYALLPFDRDGAAADYVAVPAAVLAPKPRALDHLASAAVPLAALSAYQGLFDHGRLAAGQVVLILGAVGGVGHFAVQLARGCGAHVIGTASPANADRARGFGAHQVLDPRSLGFEEALEPVDLLFDTVGGELLARSAAVLHHGGQVVSVAEQPPDGTDAAYFVVEPNRAQLVELARLVDGGKLRPVIDSVFPLAQARAAFERSMARDKIGKVVLRVVDE